MPRSTRRRRPRHWSSACPEAGNRQCRQPGRRFPGIASRSRSVCRLNECGSRGHHHRGPGLAARKPPNCIEVRDGRVFSRLHRCTSREFCGRVVVNGYGKARKFGDLPRFCKTADSCRNPSLPAGRASRSGRGEHREYGQATARPPQAPWPWPPSMTAGSRACRGRIRISGRTVSDTARIPHAGYASGLAKPFKANDLIVRQGLERQGFPGIPREACRPGRPLLTEPSRQVLSCRRARRSTGNPP